MAAYRLLGIGADTLWASTAKLGLQTRSPREFATKLTDEARGWIDFRLSPPQLGLLIGCTGSLAKEIASGRAKRRSPDWPCRVW